MPARAVFMGSPEFALPSLRALHSAYHVAGVVTQPDRKAGRGRVLTPPPVKQLALELGLDLFQPPKLRGAEVLERLAAWEPDLFVVAAYGQILRPDVLDLPPSGSINVHASLLPRWRGASPIQHAILHGDLETGITIMKMDPGLDTGPILSQSSTPITADDTAASLGKRLAQIGARLLVDTLAVYLAGKLEPVPQDDSLSTYAPMLNKQEGALDFNRPAEELARQVRAFQPWPGAFFNNGGRRIKVIGARRCEGTAAPGVPQIIDGLPAIGTSSGLLVLEELQPAGKKPMAGEVFLRGDPGWESTARVDN